MPTEKPDLFGPTTYPSLAEKNYNKTKYMEGNHLQIV